MGTIFSRTEGRPSQEPITSEDEEAVASQQETQMIYFIQQVGRQVNCIRELNPLTLPQCQKTKSPYRYPYIFLWH